MKARMHKNHARMAERRDRRARCRKRHHHRQGGLSPGIIDNSGVTGGGGAEQAIEVDEIYQVSYQQGLAQIYRSRPSSPSFSLGASLAWAMTS